MIIDKKNNKVISGNKTSALAPEATPQEKPVKPIQVESNGPMDVLKAFKTILREVKWEYGVPDSPAIFKTVQIDDGQYERIISPSGNKEETMGFPAAFVHFINWRYLVQQSRINEGRAELRIRFILNSLNVHEDDHDMDVYYVAERIHQTIQENISKYECLQERCQLEYIDPMESFDHGLQPCWMTYEIWFKQKNIWITRNKMYKKFVCPPFTNHADQDPTIEGVNPDNHTNLDHPKTYDEATDYTN
ncbi:hypothetical protein [Prevotella sp. MGM2]|uniref:hypothetical protein n=1 Tax=Prevotella sp. MGM2 TaxID=2033406 RepID=UPI000CE9C019|nr:hypothetical protein [Prevotella sp. MGM2]GAY30656.1 hypothetical protein PvtlMGM2_1509 [Prevotella sp. MGM2]